MTVKDGKGNVLQTFNKMSNTTKNIIATDKALKKLKLMLCNCKVGKSYTPEIPKFTGTFPTDLILKKEKPKKNKFQKRMQELMKQAEENKSNNL